MGRNKLAKRAKRAAEIERFDQLRQAGFVDVDKWKWGASLAASEEQQRLLAVLRNDPEATVLRSERR